jgi:hypothetical protein
MRFSDADVERARLLHQYALHGRHFLLLAPSAVAPLDGS